MPHCEGHLAWRRLQEIIPEQHEACLVEHIPEQQQCCNQQHQEQERGGCTVRACVYVALESCQVSTSRLLRVLNNACSICCCISYHFLMYVATTVPTWTNEYFDTAR